MCGRIRELTEHHVVPQILKKLIKGRNVSVNVCKTCHAKIHILLPRFNEDGSYKWTNVQMDEVLEWRERMARVRRSKTNTKYFMDIPKGKGKEEPGWKKIDHEEVEKDGGMDNEKIRTGPK